MFEADKKFVLGPNGLRIQDGDADDLVLASRATDLALLVVGGRFEEGRRRGRQGSLQTGPKRGFLAVSSRGNLNKKKYIYDAVD